MRRVCGITAAALALLITDYRLSVIFYCILAFGVQGVYMANSIASLEFSQQKRTPFYAAIIGVCCAPIVILTSFTGAAIAKAFSFRMIFGVAIGIYLLAYLSSGSLKTWNRD